MPDYRLHLLKDERIRATHDRERMDETTARETARLVFDACNDVMESHEPWQGARRVESNFDMLPVLCQTLAEVSMKRQQALRDHEATLWESFQCIQSSKKLLAMISGLHSV